MEVKSNIGDVAKDTKKLTTESAKAKKGVSGIGTAFKGIGTAMKAAGIGLVVALFAKLMQVFSQNQKVVDAFDTTMTGLSIVFNDFFSFLSDNIGSVVEWFKALFEDPTQKIKDLATSIKEGLIDRFDQLLEVLGLVAKSFGQLISGEFKKALGTIKEAGKEVVDVYTGVDGSFEKAAKTIVDYTKKTYNQAKAITATSKAAELAAVKAAELNAINLKDAETQRQIRDNVNLTFRERIEANEKLSKVLEKSAKEQKAQLQIQKDDAQLAVNQTNTTENQIALGAAKNAMLELEESINGQISEQLTNRTGLENELLEVQRTLRLESMEGLQRELAESQSAYDIKVEQARKAGEDITAITALFNKEQQAIRDAAADKEKMSDKAVTDAKKANLNSQLEAFSGLAGALQGLAGESKELAVGQAIIDTYVGANKAYAQGGTVGFVTAAAVIAAGLANVKTILATDTGAGGGGSAPAAPAPQMMSGAFDLEGGVAPEASKAFVVTDEMSNSQDQLANIRRRATI